MDIPIKLSQNIWNHIQDATSIVIISHRNPDPDTIGSNLALRQFLEYHHKKVTSACIDAVEVKNSFLVSDGLFQNKLDLNTTDLIIAVDAGSPAQLGFLKAYPTLLNGKIPVINIDHHASNNNYGTINLVVPDAASATLVLYFLFKQLRHKITPYMASCLLAGLYYDTGSFMHSNTTAEVYEVASELIKLGAKLNDIIKAIFHSSSINKLKLWGKIFSECELTDKKIVVAGVKTEDLEAHHATLSDISGAIDYLSMVKDNLFATILSEDGKGHIRGSLRTKENQINLSELASLFGGGGHKKASGFTVKGSLRKEIHWKIGDQIVN